MTVSALDADTGDNGCVTYAITAGNEGTPFRIEAGSGAIRTNRLLNREEIDHYLLHVEATDHVSNALYTWNQPCMLKSFKA